MLIFLILDPNGNRRPGGSRTLRSGSEGSGVGEGVGSGERQGEVTENNYKRVGWGMWSVMG